MMNFRVLVSCCFALLFLGSSAASAAVTVIDGGLSAYIHDTSTGVINSAGEFGATANFLALSGGGFQSQCERVVSGDSITHDMMQSREGDHGDKAWGIVYTNITVDVATTYSIFGNFTNSAGQTLVNTLLVNTSLGGQVLFAQWFSNSADTTYTAVLGGGAVGTLLPGYTYQFRTDADTQAYPNADDGATASGSFTLQFGDPDVEIVPEPASIAVWSCLGLGALGMTWVRRRCVL